MLYMAVFLFGIVVGLIVASVDERFRIKIIKKVK